MARFSLHQRCCCLRFDLIIPAENNFEKDLAKGMHREKLMLRECCYDCSLLLNEFLREMNQHRM